MVSASLGLPVNGEGRIMRPGVAQGSAQTLYCGHECGPDSGPQCDECQRVDTSSLLFACRTQASVETVRLILAGGADVNKVDEVVCPGMYAGVCLPAQSSLALSAVARRFSGPCIYGKRWGSSGYY